MAKFRSRKDGVAVFAAEVESRLMRPDAEIDLTDDDEAATATTQVLLGTLLIDRGDVPENLVELALALQPSTGRRLGEMLLDDGALSEQRARVGAGRRSSGSTRSTFPAPGSSATAIDLLTADEARRLCAIGVRRDGERVEFAVADPVIDGLKQALIAHADAPVRLVVATRSDVLDAIDRSYLDTGEIGDALREFEERFGDRRARRRGHAAGRGRRERAGRAGRQPHPRARRARPRAPTCTSSRRRTACASASAPTVRCTR